MKKLLSSLLSIFHYLAFGFVLGVFHPVQWVCLNMFGYSAHKKSVDCLNLCLVRCLYLLGDRVHFESNYVPPKNLPHIIVVNHQSYYDISPISWYLRALHPKFISKKKLGHGIPSVSYNLRHGGSILIDRSNPRQSVPEFKKFALYLIRTNHAAVIFPEGTRSRNGTPRKFSTSGLKMLFTYCPNAVVLPVTINGAWKLHRYGRFPLNIGLNIRLKVLEPFLVKDYDTQELIDKVERIITGDIETP